MLTHSFPFPLRSEVTHGYKSNLHLACSFDFIKLFFIDDNYFIKSLQSCLVTGDTYASLVYTFIPFLNRNLKITFTRAWDMGQWLSFLNNKVEALKQHVCRCFCWASLTLSVLESAWKLFHTERVLTKSNVHKQCTWTVPCRSYAYHMRLIEILVHVICILAIASHILYVYNPSLSSVYHVHIMSAPCVYHVLFICI